jgi:ABC-type iron transport system FetAB ATPase subunit
MNRFATPLSPSRRDKDREAMEDLLRRVNCNDRRGPDREVADCAGGAHRLAAVAFLSAVL